MNQGKIIVVLEELDYEIKGFSLISIIYIVDAFFFLISVSVRHVYGSVSK